MKSSMAKFFKKNSSYMFIVAIIMIALVIIFFTMNPIEKFGNSTKSLEYFYMPSCPHCKDFNPVWEELKNKVSKQGIDIKMEKYDIVGSGEERAKKFDVSSAPTILLTDGDKLLKEYNGNRNVDSILAFLK